MADMYCQNKECCYKKNSNQIRGSKGNKHYQSNKVSRWLEYWCTNGCRDQWFKDNATTCMTAVGIIPKQTVDLEDSWEFGNDYNYDLEESNRHVYFLTNRNMGVKHFITREQALSPEDIRNHNHWNTRSDSEAKPLAIQLGLAS